MLKTIVYWHKVSKTQGRWIYRPSDSDSVARKAEDYFIHKGMNGGAGGGSKPKQVYLCLLYYFVYNPIGYVSNRIISLGILCYLGQA
jgi:hypothetical protein